MFFKSTFPPQNLTALPSFPEEVQCSQGLAILRLGTLYSSRVRFWPLGFQFWLAATNSLTTRQWTMHFPSPKLFPTLYTERVK